MPLTLNNPAVIAATIEAFEITSFSVDLDRAEVHAVYVELDSNGGRQIERMLTLSGPDFSAVLTRTEELNSESAGVYAAIKLALYEQIAIATGHSGTVD